MGNVKDIGAGGGDVVGQGRQRPGVIVKFDDQLEIAPACNQSPFNHQ